MNHKINKDGLKQIKQFLMKNHRCFQNKQPDKKCLSALATEAEQHADDGNGCYIEITSFYSIHGRTQIFEISESGYAV